MAEYTAIAEVGETLVKLLRDEIDRRDDAPVIAREEVALGSPSDVDVDNVPGVDVRLTVYLYRVAENDQLKNARRQEVGVDTFREPPLALDLYYLLTAHPTGETEADVIEQQEILGFAMQVLRENGTIDGARLLGSLAEDDGFHLTVAEQSVDEAGTIWNTFRETPFRPSVAYLVTPVLIEPTTQETVQRVVEREMEYYVKADHESGEEDR